ncbi:hypothetical protein RDWZM_010234 [Blomia tropicalis]|uniref:Rab-GAP TBC domain-containing protein n=1 Tax=Blomia tropicalis TaxID=40697 RepID=A0A9Q0LYP9_BLOTA|nr:hypothetical protein RDWZM_010234 [Blomia tropicalis]
MLNQLSKLNLSNNNTSSNTNANTTNTSSNVTVRSPGSATKLTNFFASISGHQGLPSNTRHGSIGNVQPNTTPPRSPLIKTNTTDLGTMTPSKSSTTSSSSSSSSSSSGQCLGRYSVKYIGSTTVRRRHTLPMLNWIITDLIYQCKCDGDALHIQIRQCFKGEDGHLGFDELRKRLESDMNNHGLPVQFDMCLMEKKNVQSSIQQSNEIAFQISNWNDGQMLLCHQFRRVFLFGKFSRESLLFYYLHKDESNDATRTAPTLFLFQANDDNQLTDICVKYNELRPMLAIANDRHLFVNAFNNKTGVTTNCYEVAHIGSVLVSQKRASPSLVDRAARQFATMPQSNEQSTSPTPTKFGETKATTKPRQYRTNRFLVQVIDENEPLTDLNETFTQTIGNNVSSPSSTTSLISNTQSLDCETRTSLSMEFKRQQQQQQQSEPESDRTLRRSASGDTRSANAVSSGLFTIDDNNDRTSCATPERGSATPPPNRTMLFIIGVQSADHFGLIVREPYISSNTKSPSSVSGGGNNSSQSASSSQPVSSFSNETYVGHIFRCQSSSIVNELLGSLRQAFNNAYRASKARATNGTVPIDRNDLIILNEGQAKPTEPYCDNCPMNWFHQLCLDIDGLDDDTIYVLLMYRIEQRSSNEKRKEFHTILERINLSNDSASKKVDVLMCLLKAQAERMQRRHETEGCRLNSMTFFDQCQPNDSDDSGSNTRSTSSLTRLEGLRMSAKSSITNTFESIFKINKYFQSAENLPNQPQQQNQQQKTNENQSEETEMKELPLSSHRRNTLADCSLKTTVAAVAAVAAATASASSSSSSASLSSNQTTNRDSMEKVANNGLEQRSLLNIFIKATNGSANKLSSLERLSPFDDVDNKSSNQCQELDKNKSQESNQTKVECSSSNVHQSNEKSELTITTTQLRHRLFKRIKRSMKTNSGNDSLVKPLTSSRNARDLWQFAIKQQILLNKMNKQNQINQVKTQQQPSTLIRQSSTSSQRQTILESARIEYEDIPPIESILQLDRQTTTWKRLKQVFEENRIVDQSNFAWQLGRAIRDGIPRVGRRNSWLLIFSFRRNRNRPMGKYRSLLKQLATQQHAIFVDLGRTFPTVPYFAESMGSGQLALFNVLKAYSLHDKEVEYCQGLSFIAGILLLHMNEDETFDLMCYLMYDCGLRDQFKPDMESLQMQMYQLSRLLYDQERPLHDHLERYDVSPTLYAAPYFLTVFATQFPIGFVSRVFALLRRMMDRILSCNDFESIMNLLRSHMSSLTQSEMTELFETIVSFDFARQLDQYRVEYSIMQEEFAHLSTISGSNTNIVTNNGNGGIHNTKTRKSSLEVETRKPEQDTNNDMDRLRQENESLRKTINSLEDRLNSATEMGRNLQTDNEQLRTTVSQLQSRMRLIRSNQQLVPKTSDSDDEGRFVYVDAEDFPNSHSNVVQ